MDHGELQQQQQQQHKQQQHTIPLGFQPGAFVVRAGSSKLLNPATIRSTSLQSRTQSTINYFNRRHRCSLYMTMEEKQQQIEKFVREALLPTTDGRKNRFVYVRDLSSVDEVYERFEMTGITKTQLENSVSEGQLVLFSARDTYTKDGRFDPDLMINTIQAMERESLEMGFEECYITGEMSWALRGLPGCQRLIEYESKVSDLLCRPNSRIHALCQYDCNCFHSSILLSIVNTHPNIIIGTEEFENFYFIPPHEFLCPPDELSQNILNNWIQNLTERKRADEILAFRTKELEDANTSLQLECSERKKVEFAKAEIEAINKAKSLFMASVSHEIRTPLMGIVGTASLLASEKTLAKSHFQLVSIVQNSAEHLLSVINDVLTFSNFEVGATVSTDDRPIDVRALVQTTTDLFRQPARDGGMVFVSRIGDEVPVFVCGDPTRIRQVLYNLLSNALKFTKFGGTIELSVSVIPHEPTEFDTQHAQQVPESDVVFSVSDTGIGVPKDKFGFIFESFAQVESGLEKQFSGNGLGLSVSQNLCRLWGGRIWLQSEVGVGSTFYFTLPVRLPSDLQLQELQADKDQEDQEEEGVGVWGPNGCDTTLPNPEKPIQRSPEPGTQLPKKKLNILVVDDNEINRKVLAHMLQKLGHKIEVASDGVEALEKIMESRRDANTLDQFDVVFLDLLMPRLNGFDTCRSINNMNWVDRQNGSRVRRPYLIALTASVFMDCKHECQAAGMDNYMSKPTNMTQLSQLLEQVSRIRRSSA